MKRILLVALVALATFTVAAASADAASPIHWWKADGNANDSVGTNNGTLVNGAGFAAGESGQAFSLDGVSQYVSVPDDPSHYFSGSFTIDAWENTTASTGGHFILSIYECGNSCPPGANSAAQLAVANGQAQGFVRDSTGTGPDAGGQILQAGPNVADGAWHHLVFIRDVAAGKLALYVDDVKVGDAALAPGAAGALHNDDGEADPLTIGAQITGGSSAPELFFNGLIDDVKLFDTAAYPGATPTNTTAPAISGTPASGQTLTCSNGGWSNGPTSFTYQWNRDGTPIPGATGQTYVVQTADEGHSLTCTVTAANAAGSAPATSSPLAIPGGITGEQLPRVVNAGQLFCGVRHHGHCNGIPDKTEFSSPGNAVWTFGAYGTAGKAGIARTSAVVVVLGTVRRTITHAGTVRFAFKLTGAKAGRLYAEVKRKHLDVLRIKLRFTPKGGKPTTLVRSLKLKF